MSEIKKQHHLAVSLLELLNLKEIRIELQKDGSFTFVGWKLSAIKHNGSGKVIKRGTLAVK